MKDNRKWLAIPAVIGAAALGYGLYRHFRDRSGGVSVGPGIVKQTNPATAQACPPGAPLRIGGFCWKDRAEYDAYMAA